MNKFSQIAALATIPFALALPPLIGWAIGSWLDNHFGTTPYFMYILLILGFAGGVRECYKIIKRFTNNIEN